MKIKVISIQHNNNNTGKYFNFTDLYNLTSKSGKKGVVLSVIDKTVKHREIIVWRGSIDERSNCHGRYLHNVQSNDFQAGDILTIDNIYLNIGSGQKFKRLQPSWICLEYLGNTWYNYRENSINLNHDLTQKKHINIANNTVSMIYCSHLIEHLLNKHVRFMIKESYRVMKKNGIIRLTCPDAKKIFDLYSTNNHILRTWSPGKSFLDYYDAYLFSLFTYSSPSSPNITGLKKYTKQEFEKILLTRGYEETNNFFYEENKKWYNQYKSQYTGHHINWWDFNKLEKYLSEAGFREIKKVESNKCYSSEMLQNGFNSTRPTWSMFVIAKK